MKYFSLSLRLVIAAILFQTLFFKFSGAEESVYIFSTLGVEPLGRWFAGLSELIAGILVLIPMTQAIGALMSIGIMAGALLTHLFVIGIEVKGDGGLLFSLAVFVFICSLALVFIKREELVKMALEAQARLRKA